jgi:hypothetical protein
MPIALLLHGGTKAPVELLISHAHDCSFLSRR